MRVPPDANLELKQLHLERINNAEGWWWGGRERRMKVLVLILISNLKTRFNLANRKGGRGDEGVGARLPDP